MGHTLRALKRLAVLLAIWIAAGLVGYHTLSEFNYYRSLRSEVSRLQVEVDEQSSQLTRQMVQEHELRTNPEAKVDMLQRDFGFSRLDETPILIVPDEVN